MKGQFAHADPSLASILPHLFLLLSHLESVQVIPLTALDVKGALSFTARNVLPASGVNK